MKSPIKRPKYTTIAKASDFCKDILIANLQSKQNTTLSNIMEDQIETTIHSLTNKKYDFKANSDIQPYTAAKQGSGDNEPDFFPFSKIASKKKDGYDTSTQFFSQTNKQSKNQQQMFGKPKLTDFNTQYNNGYYADIPLKREAFSFKPNEGINQSKQPKYAIPETNQIWQNIDKDEITLIPQQKYIDEKERVNSQFQHQSLLQEHLADQYYVEKDKTKSQGVKYGYITSKVRSDSLDGLNNSAIHNKLENEIQKNLVNPYEIDIKSKNKILGKQVKTKEGLKLIRLKNQPKNSYRYHKEKMDLRDPIHLATNHPEFHKNTLILASPKSFEQNIEKTKKKVNVEKIDIQDFNAKYKKYIGKDTQKCNRNAISQSDVKKILKKEAGRIKKEIEIIKSNLESYRTVPSNNMIVTSSDEKQVKSEKFSNLHNLIKNSLYN